MADDLSIRVGVANLDQVSAAISKALEDAFTKPNSALAGLAKNIDRIADTSAENLKRTMQSVTEAVDATGDAAGNAKGGFEEIVKAIQQISDSVSKSFTALNDAFAGIGERIKQTLAAVDNIVQALERLERLGGGAGSAIVTALNGAAQTSSVFSDNLDILNTEIDTLADGSKSFIDAYKDFFPASVIEQLNIQNEKLVGIQKALNDETRQYTELDLAKLRLEYKAVEREILTLRQTGVTAAVAQREAESSASRERIATARSESQEKQRLLGLQIAQAQIAAKAQSDAVRTSAQIQVADTQAAAKQRVAIFSLVARAFETTERIIIRTAELTAGAISTAFRASLNVITSLSGSITAVFKRSGDTINSNFSQTMSRNETILQNSVSNQQTTISNFAQNASRALSSVGVGTVGAAGGLFGIGALVGRALTGGFRRQALLEESERALTILLGDAEKAVELRERVLDVVVGTPFRLDQFADAAAQLVAFNVQADKVPRFLQAIADSAAVRGGNAAQSIDTLVRVFGQVTTTARISLTDINSIAGAGVPALEILANTFGVTTDEIREMVSEGAIPAQEALDALTEGILNGTEGVNGATQAFGGLAKGLGNTTRGAIANFGTALDRLGANVIGKFQPLIIAFVGLATQLVDTVGKVTSNIADTISKSPLAGLLVDIANIISKSLKTALDVGAGAIKAFSDGILFASTAIGGFLVVQRIPLLLNLVRFAILRLLTPLNIAFVAFTALGTFFSGLIDESPALRNALRDVGEALRAAFEPIASLITTVVPALLGLFRDLASGGVGVLSSLVLRVLVPALESLARFITNVVAPAIAELTELAIDLGARAFAELSRFVTDTLIPGLQTGFDIAVRGVRVFVDFVRSTIIPVVIPALIALRDIAIAVFTAIADFAEDVLLPVVSEVFGALRGALTDFVETAPEAFREFVRNIREAFDNRSFQQVFEAFKTLLSRFNPLAAAAGAAVALAFFNPFAAVLAGLGIGIAGAFGPDLINLVRPQLQRFGNTIREFFTEDTLGGIAGEILELVNTVGQILGSIVSDPRVVGIAAAIGAAAVTIGAAFVTGFIEGVIRNLPSLAEGFITVVSRALFEALDAAVSNPETAAKIAAVFVAGAVITKVIGAGKVLGAVLPGGIAQGIQQNIGKFSGVFGGARGLLRGLFGGPAALRSAAAATAADIISGFQAEFRRNRRLLDVLGVQAPAVIQATGAGGQFGGDTQQTAAQNAQAVNEVLREQIALYGETAIAGASIRVGFERIFSGIGDGIRRVNRDFRGFLNTGDRTFAGLRTTAEITSRSIRKSFQQVRTGVLNVFDGIRAGAGAAFAAAGTFAASAFATSFASQGLFQEGASFETRATSVLGVAASFGATAAALGPKAAAAAAGVGLLVGAFQASAEKAAQAEQRIRDYADELQEFEDVANEFDFINREVNEIFDTFTEQQLASLREAGIGKDEFSAAFRQSLQGDEDAFRRFVESLSVDLKLEGFGASFGQQVFDESAILAQEAKRAIDRVSEILEAETRAGLLIDLDFEDASGAAQTLKGEVDAVRGSIDNLNVASGIAEEALTAAFNAEKGTLEADVRAAETALNDAKRAADDALAAALGFFNLEALDFNEAVDQAVTGASTIVNSFAEAQALGITQVTDGVAEGTQTAVSAWRTAARGVVDDVKSIVSAGLADGTILTEEDAQAALAPYYRGILEAAGPVGEGIAENLTASIEAGDFDASVVAEQLRAAGETGAADAIGVIGTTLDEAFEDDELQATLDVIAELNEEAIPALQTTFDEAEIALSNFVIDDVAISNAANLIVTNLSGDLSTEENKTKIAEAAATWVEGISEALTDDTTVGQSAADVMKAAEAAVLEYLEASSPSRRAAREIGLPFVEGIDQGITDNTSLVEESSGKIGRELVDGAIQGIDNRSSALYARIRLLINTALQTARTAAEISSPSALFARDVGDPIVQGIILGIVDNEFEVYDSLDGLITGLVRQLDDSLLEFRSTGNALADEIGFGIADQGAGVLGSIGSIIGLVYEESLSEAQLFEEVGREIAFALFSGLGTSGGSFGSIFEGAGLQLAFFDIIDSSTQFGEALARIREDFELSVNTFDIASQAGREAQRAFFSAGSDIREYALTLIEAGRPLSNVIGETTAWRDSLVATAIAAGATTEQVNELIFRLGLTDAQLAAFVKETAETQKAAQEAAAEAKRLREEERKQREAEEKARRAYAERERREREEERKREEAAREKERQAREEERKREEAAREKERQEREAEERARREQTLPPAAFQNLIINTPAGDPEAVALLTANRVAYSIRGT